MCCTNNVRNVVPRDSLNHSKLLFGATNYIEQSYKVHGLCGLCKTVGDLVSIVTILATKNKLSYLLSYTSTLQSLSLEHWLNVRSPRKAYRLRTGSQ
jgi:hypothetical protein